MSDTSRTAYLFQCEGEDLYAVSYEGRRSLGYPRQEQFRQVMMRRFRFQTDPLPPSHCSLCVFTVTGGPTVLRQCKCSVGPSRAYCGKIGRPRTP